MTDFETTNDFHSLSLEVWLLQVLFLSEMMKFPSANAQKLIG